MNEQAFEILTDTARCEDGVLYVRGVVGGANVRLRARTTLMMAEVEQHDGPTWVRAERLAARNIKPDPTAIERDRGFVQIGQGVDPDVPHREYVVGKVGDEPAYYAACAPGCFALTATGAVYRVRDIQPLEGSGVALSECVQVFKAAGITTVPTGDTAWDVDAARKYATDVAGGVVPLTNEQIIDAVEAAIHELDLRVVTTRLLDRLIPAPHNSIVSAVRGVTTYKGARRWYLTPAIYDVEGGEHVLGEDAVERVEWDGEGDDFGRYYVLRSAP